MKRIGFGLIFVVMLLLAGNAFVAQRVQSRWAGKMAALQAAGEPTSLAELAPAPIPDALNVAAQLDLLAGEVEEFGKDQTAWLNRTPLGKAYEESQADANPLPTAEQAAAMREILNKHSSLGAGISRAAALDVWASRADYTTTTIAFIQQLSLPRIQSFRQIARFAAWEMAVLARENNGDQAVRRGIELLRLARQFQREPTLVAYLVAIAVRGVAIESIASVIDLEGVTMETRSALDEELSQADTLQPLVDTMRAERAYNLQVVDELVDDSLASRLFLRKARSSLAVIDWFEGALPAVGKPWHELRAQPGASAAFNMPEGAGEIVETALPAVTASYDAANQNLAMVRALRVLNALYAYADEHGEEASGLESLGLAPEAMVDPFSGKPLLLKRTKAGWIVYSVGRNKKDDGGIMDYFSGDVGVGPPTEAVK